MSSMEAGKRSKGVRAKVLKLDIEKLISKPRYRDSRARFKRQARREVTAALNGR